MFSFRKALKSKQRDHTERSQLGFRKHLGLLEKKKNYKLRADNPCLTSTGNRKLSWPYGRKLWTKTQKIGWGSRDKVKGERSDRGTAEGDENPGHQICGNEEGVRDEVEDFDLARHLNTVPELVGRAYNRPTIQTLESIIGVLEPQKLQKLAKQRRNQYEVLSQRIDREKKMFIINQKIQTRKDLQDKVKKVKVRKETTTAPAIFKFEAKRKR